MTYRTGKIKGIERFLGAVDTLEPSLMEVTSGQAKYEHQHRAIVWRMPRLPKEGQGAYTTHNLVCRMQLTSYDQIPDNLAEYAYVEFTMPATQVRQFRIMTRKLSVFKLRKAVHSLSFTGKIFILKYNQRELIKTIYIYLSSNLPILYFGPPSGAMPSCLAVI